MMTRKIKNQSKNHPKLCEEDIPESKAKIVYKIIP